MSFLILVVGISVILDVGFDFGAFAKQVKPAVHARHLADAGCIIGHGAGGVFQQLDVRRMLPCHMRDFQEQYAPVLQIQNQLGNLAIASLSDRSKMA